MKRVFLSALALAVAFAALGTAAPQAQDFPTKPVTIVVPFNAGGPTDTIARMLAEGLSKKWGQPVVVANKPGAGTVVGTDYVVKSTPDGHTLGVGISALYINPAVRKSLPYDTLKSVAGVSIYGVTQVMLIAHPDFPANNPQELIAYAKTQPDGLGYAIAGGTGSSTHMAGELLAQMAGIKLRAIPYNGSGPALADLTAGRVPLMFDPWPSVQQQLAGGKVKVIANGSSTPVPGKDFPSLPKALPGYDAPSIQGIFTAAGTPKTIVQKISADLQEIVKNDPINSKLKQFGIEPVASTAEEYDRVIREETEKWSKTAKAAGISIE